MAISTITTQPGLPHAPMTGITSTLCVEFCELYEQRFYAIRHIKQLLHMMRSLQRHRGMTMGTLGGNFRFRDDLDQLHAQLERRLQLLMAFSCEHAALMSERDHTNLCNAWETISNNWQQDSVIDNYELHCHLIEHMLTLIGSLGKHLEYPASHELRRRSASHHDQPHPHRFKLLELLHFTTRLMPSVLENIGRIRALSTYSAAVGYCDHDFSTKLRYVISCTRVNNEKLRHQSKRLDSMIGADLPSLQLLKSYEIKLDVLLSMVESDIIESSHLSADSSRFFNLASDIMDAYLTIVDDGMQLLAQWHEGDLDTWVQTQYA